MLPNDFPDMQKILIVDDTPEILAGLEVNLARSGFGVLKATRGDEALRLALNENPAVIVLDIMLPKVGGLDVCQELRRRGVYVPIILLSALGSEADRVVGLRLGADDYVTKPFSVMELMARIEAHLRRQERFTHVVDTYECDGFRFDFTHQRCTRHGELIHLSAREFEILRLLIRERGENVSRERILSHAFCCDPHMVTRTVDAHVSRLRRKLGPRSDGEDLIVAVWGDGYKFVG
jgi:two-component system alkaline phosphatase synthesis response regulator PhoP